MLVVCLKTFVDNLFSVIRTSTGFGSFQTPRNAYFDRSVEVENALGFAYNLFEVDSLINSSGEAIYQIVLNNGYLAEK